MREKGRARLNSREVTRGIICVCVCCGVKRNEGVRRRMYLAAFMCTQPPV